MTQDAGAVTHAVRLLADVSRRVGASLALDETLDAVATAVVDALGFRAAVVNLAEPYGPLHVAAVAGSQEVCDSLRGTSSPRAAWDALLAASSDWGGLRFLGHDAEVPEAAQDMQIYVPPLQAPDAAAVDAWHPEDALFAPLWSSHGELLGVLSVDDPVDGKLPSLAQRAMLEAFAVQAALAIEHAHEHKAIRDSETLLQRLFDESPVGKALVDAEGRYKRVNRAYSRFLGRVPEDFVGRHVVEFAHPEERAGTLALLREIRAAGSVPKVERRYQHADGHELWGRLRLTRIGTDADMVILAAIEDITDARLAEEQLRHNALHDSLTGLPNRTLIFDRLAQALARGRREGTATAVIVLDIDHFKLVNDSYGHPVGDQLLRRVAAALHECMRDSDTAGRMGGDEFIVVCEGITSTSDAVAVAERLQQAVRVPVDVDGVALLPSASLGCTVSGVDATPDQLVAEADAALYRAKAGGRGRVEVYDDEMRATMVSHHELRAQLADGLDREEFRLHYQPILGLEAGETLGYEALLRWEHPRGLLSPADFLTILTEGDLDAPVTRWVLHRACADVASIAAKTGERPFVSVNLSPRQLGRPDLAADVASALHAAGLHPSRLWLEITEEHFVDERHRAMLDRLEAFGCRIVLDDFGTGYSGLTYLQQLPVHVLKIDRAFTARIGTDRVSSGITSALADLAEVLGIRVVAEGVETEAQAELLRDMGVPLAQGYYFGRPEALGTDGLPTARLPRQRGRAGQPALATVNDSMTTGCFGAPSPG